MVLVGTCVLWIHVVIDQSSYMELLRVCTAQQNVMESLNRDSRRVGSHAPAGLVKTFGTPHTEVC